jgi:hypothetical protein
MRIVIAAFAFLVLQGGPLKAAPKKIATITDAPVAIEKGSARRIFIVGFSGRVHVIPHAKQQIIVRATRTLEYEDIAGVQDPNELLRQLVVRTGTTGDLIEIRAQLPPQRTDWNEWAQGKHAPQAKIDIYAPDSMTLDIYWARGDVKVIDWKAPVTVTNQEGKVTLEKIAGDIIVRGMFGSAKVDSIKGNVSIENFSSPLQVSNITGRLKLRTFSGETRVRSVTGPVIVTTQKAPVFTTATTGPMEVQTGIAAVQISDHRGTLRGHAETGSIEAKLSGPVDASLTSDSGDLLMAVPRSSQADVSLTTAKGSVAAPKTLDRKRSTGSKSVRGTLNGSESGRVRLSSESGDLSLKIL